MENELEAQDAVAEVDDTPEVEDTPQSRINDMIAAALKGDYVDANSHFNDILGDRVDDAMNQEKIRIAAAIYGEDEPEESSDEPEETVDEVESESEEPEEESEENIESE